MKCCTNPATLLLPDHFSSKLVNKMSTSSSPSLTPTLSLFLTHPPSLSPPFHLHLHRHRRRHLTLPYITLRNTTLRLCSPISHTHNTCRLLSDDPPPPLSFNGWDFPSPPPQSSDNNRGFGFPTFLVVGFGTSILLLLAAFTRFSFLNYGFRIPYKSSTADTSEEIAVHMTDTNPTVSEEGDEVLENSQVESSDVVIKSVTSEKHHSRVVNVVVDSNQQEAVLLLKKLKILEEDVKGNELCTRREYARWLVRANSILERNPKYKITTSAALSGSVISAYEDVDIEDPDFKTIQALAESGVISSKLSTKHKLDEGALFFPERFLSRLDLIEWKSQLEYDFATAGFQETHIIKLDLMDVREISPGERPGLFMDMLAGDKSLLRRVFGQIRRLQPSKPSTIAQVAIALTSGRMVHAIQNEILRMQSEELSRNSAKEEIKQELLSRGEIERFWVEKMEEEKQHGLEVQQLYMEALKHLEEEKIVQEGALNGFLKEKAAMDCQKQLLECLKQEIDEISERLATERAEHISEQQTAQTLRFELQTKKEGILDAKSLLEAEIEALRILRSWIEDEARKSEARSKVLEEVGRRWKWDRQ